MRAAGADKEFKGNNGNGNASNGSNYTNTNSGNTSVNPPGKSDRVKVDKTLDPLGQEIPLTLIEDLNWGSLEFIGGKITGSHLLKMDHTTSVWSGGEFSAVTFNTPGLTIGSGSSAKKVSNGAKLNLSGTTNWNADKITTGGGSELNNSGTFTAHFDGRIEHDNTDARAIFKNDGTFTKSNASSGTTEVEAIFNNNAAVNVNGGTLKLSGGGTSASGSSVSISSGATLQLSGNDYAFTGSTLSGAGTIDVAGATTTFSGHSGDASLKVSGGTAKFNSSHTSSGSLTVASGIVDGSSSATTSVGGFIWNGGDIKTTKVNSSGTATIGAGSAKKLIGGAQLTLGGTTTWDGSTLSTGGASQLTNQATGSFTVTGDGTIAHDIDGNRATFTNAGTFTKSAGSTGSATEIQTKFDNTGTVSIGAGKLKLTGGGSSTGNVSVAGTLEVSGNNYAFTGGTLSGAGSIDLLGATTTFNAVTSNTTFKINGGTAKFDGTNVGGGKLSLTAGAVTGNGTADFSSLDWSGGSLETTLKSTGNVTISGAGTKTLTGNLTLSGNTTWDGSTIAASGTARIKNESGKTFSATADGAITGTATFTNDGIFEKTAGATGATDIQSKFDNTGTVSIAAGKLKLTGGGTSTGNVSVAGTLEVSGNNYAFTGGTLNGAGSIDLLGATTTFNAVTSNTTFKVNGGTAKFDGTNVGGGKLELTSGTVSGTGTAEFSSLEWSGGNLNGKVKTTTSATLTGHQTIGAAGELTIAGSLSSTGTLTNQGKLIKQGASVTTNLTTAFDNTGTSALVQIDSGTLKLSGGGKASGNVTVASGGKLDVASSYTFEGATLSGTGDLELTAATTKFKNSSSSAKVSVNGGNLDFEGTATLGTLSLSNGSVTTTGTTTADVTSLEWSGGNLNGKVKTTTSATLTGHQTIGAAGELTIAGSISSTGTLTNQGKLIKQGASVTTNLTTAFDNTGTSALVQIDSGTLKLSGGGKASGNVTVASGGKLDVASSYTFEGATLSGTGDLELTAATTKFKNSSSSAKVSVNGGNLDFEGTATLGTLSLSNGSVTTTGTTTADVTSLEWAGGNLNGKIKTTGNTTISGTAKTLGGELTLDGNTTWTGSSIAASSNAKIKNESGRTFTSSGDGTITNGGGVTFTNNGTFSKPSGTTDIQARFDNNGALQVSGGKLKLSGGGASSGQVTIAGTLEVGGTDYTFGTGAFTNTGQVDIKSGSVAINGGGASNGGHFNVASGGRLNFGSNYSLSGGKILGQGRASINGTLFVTGTTASEVGGIFELKKNSAIGGNGQLFVSGQLEWLGGDMFGSGVTKIVSGGQLLLSGADSKRVFEGVNASGGRAIENSGLVAMNGTGGLLFGDGAAFDNQAGGNFDLRSDAGIGSTGTGNKGAFANSGTLHKSAGNGVSSIAGIHFTNNSTVWAQSGTLSFDDAVTNNGGTFQASPGAAISFNGNHARVFAANSRFVGGGAHAINAGANTFSGDFTAQNLTFSGGTLTGPATLHGSLTWTGGDWISGSTFTVATDGVLTIDGPGAKRLYHGSASSGGRVLANEGTIIVQGAGQVQLGDGAQLTIARNATLDIRNDGTIGHSGAGNQGAVVNHGTILKGTSHGTATIAQPFTQSSDGKIVVNNGTLAFTSSFTNNNGGITVAHGAAISFGATFNTGTGALTGTGTIHAANVTAGGLVSPGTSPGTLTLTGNLSLLSTSTLLFELGGATPGVGHDLLSVGGSAALGGNLSLQFLNGFHTTMAPGSTFTVLTSAGITGSFANVTNGQKLLTSDGIGFFQVNYGTGSAFGANNIVLSNFTAVPEPSTYVMLGLGAVIVIWQVRRRRR